MNKNKKIYKRLLIILIACYVLFTLINQQSTINQYTDDSKKLAVQLEEAQEYKEQLAKEKEEVDSIEFIEQTAREKLDMYLPNERVYVDAGI
ncbi:MAG: septum formation initiator family protein [Clostridia bacterium]|nr:septum formation initiator family protein [Clostridia bacterium]